jgi:TPR repeat protein
VSEAQSILSLFGKVAGIGGLALGVFLLLFREVIRKQIFPTLSDKQAYSLIRLFLYLTFSIAALGIFAYVFMSAPTHPSQTVPPQLVQGAFDAVKDSCNEAALRSFISEYENVAGAGPQVELIRLRLSYCVENNHPPKPAGSPTTVYGLAFQYDYGQGGVEQDFAKARELYMQAANTGNGNAMYNLGFMYATGRGVAVNIDEARQWYEKAVQHGIVTAYAAIGGLYETDPPNFAEARQWYEKGVAAGDIGSMYSLAYMYDEGHGVQRDYAKARDLYQQAGDAGNGNAMFNLALMYATGKGGILDVEKARQLYQRAVNAGIEPAREQLKRLQ